MAVNPLGPPPKKSWRTLKTLNLDDGPAGCEFAAHGAQVGTEAESADLTSGTLCHLRAARPTGLHLFWPTI